MHVIGLREEDRQLGGRAIRQRYPAIGFEKVRHQERKILLLVALKIDAVNIARHFLQDAILDTLGQSIPRHHIPQGLALEIRRACGVQHAHQLRFMGFPFSRLGVGIVKIIHRLADLLQIRVHCLTVGVVRLIGEAARGNRPGFDRARGELAAAVAGWVDLSREADAIVIAPASTDFLAKLAHGMADDLLSTLCIARDCPLLVAPAEDSGLVELIKGPNIESLPEFEPLPARFSGPVLLKLGDDVSTDEIMPAGAEVLPLRSNIPAIAKYVFRAIDPDFSQRARALDGDGFFLVAGRNYGQGSSREHAAIAPRYLGLRVVCALSYGRIHRQNLANFGVVPLTFADPNDLERIDQGDELALNDPLGALASGDEVRLHNRTKEEHYTLHHGLTQRQIAMIRSGSLIHLVREET